MGSRIAHHIDFPDFTLDELVAIAYLMLEEQKYQFSEVAEGEGAKAEADGQGDGQVDGQAEGESEHREEEKAGASQD